MRSKLAAVLPLFLVAVLALVGCSAAKGPSTPPREQVRAGIVLVAYAVKGLDHLCYEVAMSIAEQDPDFRPPPASDMIWRDPAPGRGPPLVLVGAKLDAAMKLAKRCDAAYASARDALVAADDLVDSLDTAKAKEVGCAVSKALAALEEYVAALKEAGVTDVPPTVQDALAVAKALAALSGSSCPIPGAAP